MKSALNMVVFDCFFWPLFGMFGGGSAKIGATRLSGAEKTIFAVLTYNSKRLSS